MDFNENAASRNGKTGPAGGTADTVFMGGAVHTLDDDARMAEAIAVSGETIAAIGSDDDVARFIGARTRIVDLQGRAVLPGINDAHLHGAWYGASWPKLMFETPLGEFHVDKLATEEARVAAITSAWRQLAALGITSYTEPGIGPGEDGGETGCFSTAILDTYARLAGTPAQTARVTYLRLFGLLDGPSTLDGFLAGLDTPVPHADPRWLATTGVKIFADGIPPLRSAWMIDPYRDDSHGGLMTDDGTEAERLAAFRTMITRAHQRGLQVGVHATGDRTIEEFVATVEALGGAGDLRHYVIHGDLARPGQLERMAKAGIGIDLQPLIAEKTGDWLAEAVSAETAAQAWRFDLIVGRLRGAILSSDAPVAGPDWRRIVASAARRLEAQGIGVGRDVLTELLRMYTIAPARQDQAESWKGTLEAGKVADLCVLGADPYVAGVAALPDITVDLTMVGGRIVHQRPMA